MPEVGCRKSNVSSPSFPLFPSHWRPIRRMGLTTETQRHGVMRPSQRFANRSGPGEGPDLFAHACLWRGRGDRPQTPYYSFPTPTIPWRKFERDSFPGISSNLRHLSSESPCLRGESSRGAGKYRMQGKRGALRMLMNSGFLAPVRWLTGWQCLDFSFPISAFSFTQSPLRLWCTHVSSIPLSHLRYRRVPRVSESETDRIVPGV